jgi:ferritin
MEYTLFKAYAANQRAILGDDPATFNFIQGFVNIQNESVAEYSDLLNALLLVNPNNKLDLLYFENQYFG